MLLCVLVTLLMLCTFVCVGDVDIIGVFVVVGCVDTAYFIDCVDIVGSVGCLC